MIEYLPEIDKGNDDLSQFLGPFDNQFEEIKILTKKISALCSWHKIPEKLIDLLSTNIGFEIIDSPYANENERKHFLQWAVWIYKHKGTPAALEKLIELCGFEYNITESYPDYVPLILNFHRLYSISMITMDEYNNDFSQNMSGLSVWNLLSYWRITSGKLYGTGNGSNDDTNIITVVNSEDDYYFETEFEIDGSFGNDNEFGLVLKYIDSNNWLKLEIQKDGSGDVYLKLIRCIASSETEIDLGTILIDVSTGTHKLWAWGDSNDKFTVGIDSKTFGYSKEQAGLANGNKGFFVNRSLTLKFDNLSIRVLNKSQAAKLYTDSFTERKLQIELIKDTGYLNLENSYIDSTMPDTNYSSSSDLIVNSANNYKGLIRRVDIANNLGSNDIILSAKLRLYCNTFTGTNLKLSILRVFKPWVESTVTWNDWNGPDDEWGSSGCNNDSDDGDDNSGDGTDYDCASTATDIEDMTGTGWIELDITDLAKLWYAGSIIENGIILIADGGDATVHFNSSRATSNKPEIVITTSRKEAKENYLHKITKNYIPAGVNTTWI